MYLTMMVLVWAGEMQDTRHKGGSSILIKLVGQTNTQKAQSVYTNSNGYSPGR